MICEDILKLTEYGMVTGLVPKEDERFTINRLLELFELEELDEDAVAAYQSRTPMSREEAEESLEELLNRLLDYAYEKGILKENSIVYRDLFDTKIMGMLMPRPGEVIHKFQSLYEKDAKAATDYYYTLSQDSNGPQRRSLVNWILQLTYPSRKRTRKPLQLQSWQNRAAIRNAFCVRKMKVMQEESTTRQDRITVLFR